jgi:hypothetical protein
MMDKIQKNNFTYYYYNAPSSETFELWIYVDGLEWWAVMNTVTSIWVLQTLENVFTSWAAISFSGRALLHGVG